VNKADYPGRLPVFLIWTLALATALALGVSQYFIWYYAPLEQTMGLVQKIFYFHLPLAWWSLVAFFVVFIASVLVLWKRSPAMDDLAGAAAEIGVLMSGLALLSGMLWAKKAWNTWWTWDPRLTTALVMWFVYAAYLVLRSSGLDREKRRFLSAVLGILAFLDVPLVFLSARLWRSIHPTVLANTSGGLEPEMWTTVLICLGAWGGLFVLVLYTRWRQYRSKQGLEDLVALMSR
jgi:heme exporter protein C